MFKSFTVLEPILQFNVLIAIRKEISITYVHFGSDFLVAKLTSYYPGPVYIVLLFAESEPNCIVLIKNVSYYLFELFRLTKLTPLFNLLLILLIKLYLRKINFH